MELAADKLDSLKRSSRFFNEEVFWRSFSLAVEGEIMGILFVCSSESEYLFWLKKEFRNEDYEANVVRAVIAFNFLDYACY